MKSLHLFYIFHSSLGPEHELLWLVQRLLEQCPLHLTLVFNGCSVKKWALPVRYESIELPLCFGREALFLEVLSPALFKAGQVLFLEQGTHWNPLLLQTYRSHLADWHAMTPFFQASDKAPYSLDPLAAQEPVVPWDNAPYIPGMILFSATDWEVLCEWVKPQGQMAIVYVGQLMQDQGKEALSAEAPLTVHEAQARYQEALSLPKAQAMRQQVLLESLLRAFPRSELVYLALLPHLNANGACEILAQALRLGVHTPAIWGYLSLALMATGQENEAVALKNLYDQRFSKVPLPRSSWQAESCSKPALFQQALLPPASIKVLIWGCHKKHIRALAAQFEAFDCVALVPQPLGFQGERITELSWRDPQFLEQLEQALQTTDYCLLLNTLDFLSPAAYQKIMALCLTWQWVPPTSPKTMAFKIQRAHTCTQIVYPQWRLFSKETLLQDPSLLWNTGQLIYPEEVSEDIGVGQRPMTPTEHKTHTQKWRQFLRLYDASGLALGLSFLTRAEFEKARAQFQDAGQTTKNTAAWLSLWQMHCAYFMKDWPALETLLETSPRHVLRVLDYWFYKGVVAEKKQAKEQAIMALEACLSLKTAVSFPYTLGFLENQAFHVLRLLYWQDIFNLDKPIQTHQSQLQKLKEILLKHLRLFPEGDVPGLSINLYDFLAQVCIVSAHYHPGESPLALFRQSLPAERPASVYFLETAMMSLEGFSVSLLNRLPPVFTREELKTLSQSRDYLYPFLQKLWDCPEFEGPDLAACFVHCASVYHQDPRLMLFLAQKYLDGEAVHKAEDLLRAALEIFPRSAQLHFKLSGILLASSDEAHHSQGRTHLEKAALLAPELDFIQTRFQAVQNEGA